MAIQPMNDDVQIIQHLSDNPNQDDGLSAAQMKEKFDAASVLIKAYLNGTLVPAVQQLQKALNNGEIIGVDDTLSIAGQAADAKATGDALAKKAEYVLLWSNASKTSAFVGQSLAVSTVGYDYLMIVCGYGTYARNGTTATHYRLRPIGDGDTEVGLAVNYISDTLGLSIPFRKLVVSLNRKSLTFDTGHRSDGTEDNAYCIPYYIYGIKGVSNQ